MKPSLKNPARFHALIAGLGLALAGRAPAQTFTNLHNFTGVNDGVGPDGGLILSGSTLFGTAENGGSGGSGTVFALNTNGSGYTNLHNFTNNDGAQPTGRLILSGNNLYGTATYGGSSDYGTVFAVSTNGTSFTNMHSFTGGSAGGLPMGGLVLWGATLFGTAADQLGHSVNSYNPDSGTVFAINTDGTSFTNLYSFSPETTDSSTGLYTNCDGYSPQAGLILSGTNLYGMTYSGGTGGWGTVFAVGTDGMGFTNLHSFTNGNDGAYPQGGLILSGNTLYGTASQGGSSHSGTVFAVNTDGTGFTILHSFTALNFSAGVTNSDGATPFAGLILSGDILYGVASQGGSAGSGTVFALNTNGTFFTVLYNFTALSPSFPELGTNSDGALPTAGLILSDNTLYGTTGSGGIAGHGTIFGLSLPVPPQLSITLSGTNVVLKWTNTVFPFTLQSTTNLSPTSWSAVSPSPVVINGQNTVTNPITGTQQFYQLSQ